MNWRKLPQFCHVHDFLSYLCCMLYALSLAHANQLSLQTKCLQSFRPSSQWLLSLYLVGASCTQWKCHWRESFVKGADQNPSIFHWANNTLHNEPEKGEGVEPENVGNWSLKVGKILRPISTPDLTEGVEVTDFTSLQPLFQRAVFIPTATAPTLQ